MSNQSYIILYTLLSGTVAVGMAIVCGGYLYMSAIGKALGGTFKPKILELPLLISCLIGLVASFMICPLTSYYLRDAVRNLTDDFYQRFVIFAFIACFQIIGLVICYSLLKLLGPVIYRLYIRIHEIKFASHNSLVRQLDEARVSVTVKNAGIVRDDGKIVCAEIKLQIKNVPFVIPCYEMDVFDIGDTANFAIGAHKLTDPEKVNSRIEVLRENDKWIFREFQTGAFISDNTDNVTFQIEFLRRAEDKTKLPDKITMRLGIWKRDDNAYMETHQFFLKTIPIKFDGS
jgi:hypothetical protein